MNDRFPGDAASQDPTQQAQWQQGSPQPPQQWQPPAQPQQWQQPAQQQPWAPAAPQPYPAQPPAGQGHPGQPYPGPYPGQQPSAPWPPTAPRKPRATKGLLVATGAVVVVAAVGVTLALVLQGDGSSAEQTVPRVVDLATKPTAAWTVDLLDDADSAYVATEIPVAVGDDLALVWSTFDSYTWDMEQTDSSGWYEDFDAHYDRGVIDGTAYLAAEEAAEQLYEDDWSADVDWPQYADYWPADFVGDWDDYNYDYLGYYAGFEDIAYGNDVDESRIPAPEAIDFVPSVTLLDVTDGQERWTADLVSVEPDVDHSWFVNAVSLDGGATVAVSMVSGWDNVSTDQRTTIGTLDVSDGSVISTTSVDGIASIHGLDGALLVVSDSGEDVDVRVMSRLDPTSLDADPLWESEIDALAYPSTFAAGQISLSDDEGVEVLSTLDGTTVWEGERLLSVGSSVLTLEEESEDSSTYTLEAITEDGDSPWEEPLEVAAAWSVDGYLFTAAKGSGADYSDAGYTKIQRVNPATGEELWDAAVDEVSYIVGVSEGTVVAIADGRLVLVDLRKGEETASYKIKDADSGAEAWLGTENVYISAGGSLLAYSLADDGKQWSYGIDDDAYVNAIGRHLTFWNYASGELSGLGVK